MTEDDGELTEDDGELTEDDGELTEGLTESLKWVKRIPRENYRVDDGG